MFPIFKWLVFRSPQYFFLCCISKTFNSCNHFTSRHCTYWVECSLKIVQKVITHFLVNPEQLIEWLKGFQDVQIELNACVGCLEDGVSQINVLKGDDDNDDSNPNDVAEPQPEQVIEESPTKKVVKVIHLTDDQTEQDNFDQVFEAFVAEERCSLKTGLVEDEFVPEDGSGPISRHSSKFLMKELKQVLVGKAEEHRIREEIAIERQHKRLQNGNQNFFLFPK